MRTALFVCLAFLGPRAPVPTALADDGPHTRITTIDEAKQRRPGACFEVRVADTNALLQIPTGPAVPDNVGELLEAVCDGDDGDLDGEMLFHNLPMGVFTMLIETMPTDGCELAEPEPSRQADANEHRVIHVCTGHVTALPATGIGPTPR